MLEIMCKSCEGYFGVDGYHVKRGIVKIAFHCAYCDQQYAIGDGVIIEGVSGGVNISGADVKISGDVAGRDLYR